MVQAQFRLVPGTSRKAPGAPDFQTDFSLPLCRGSFALHTLASVETLGNPERQEPPRPSCVPQWKWSPAPLSQDPEMHLA